MQKQNAKKLFPMNYIKKWNDKKSSWMRARNITIELELENISH